MKLGARGEGEVLLGGQGPLRSARKPRKPDQVASRAGPLAAQCAVPAPEGVTVLNPGVALLMRMRSAAVARAAQGKRKGVRG